MKRALSILVGILGTLLTIGGIYARNVDMISKDTTVGVVFGGLTVALIGLALFYHYRAEKHVEDTQRIISDLEILQLFEQQPGGILTSELMAEKTALTKAQAHTRLYALAHGALLATGTNPSGTKAYYELSAPLEYVDGLELSNEPFLVVEDLQKIFVAYDYKVSPHDLMVSTHLPWKVLSREMQYFRKEGIVDVAYIIRPGDSPKQYILNEAYHQSDALDLNKRDRINAEVKKVLYDEQYLV